MASARGKKRSAVLSSWLEALAEVNAAKVREDDAVDTTGKCLSTGSLTVDLALGGGIGEGRMLALVGPEKSGKTTLQYETILKAYAERGIEPVIYDHEASFDWIYMQKIADAKYPGLRIDRFIRLNDKSEYGPQNYFSPEYGEWTFEHIGKCLNVLKRTSEKVGGKSPRILFVIDSLAAMTPKASLSLEEVSVDEDGEAKVESKDGNKSMGAMSRMFSDELRKVKARIRRAGCYLLATNQIRNKIGVMFGNPETEPGGNAVAHYADQRIRIGPVSPPPEFMFGASKMKGQGGITGVLREDHVSGVGWDKLVMSRGVVTKNKIGPPLRDFCLRMIISEQGGSAVGIDAAADCAMYLLATGQLRRSVGYYEFRVLGVGDETGSRDVVFTASRQTWADVKQRISRPGLEESIGGIEVYGGEEDAPFDLLAHSWAQLESGAGSALYAEVQRAGQTGAPDSAFVTVESLQVEGTGSKAKVTGLHVRTAFGSLITLSLASLPATKSSQWLANPALIVGKRVKAAQADMAEAEASAEGEGEGEKAPEIASPSKKAKKRPSAVDSDSAFGEKGGVPAVETEPDRRKSGKNTKRSRAAAIGRLLQKKRQGERG